MFINEPIEQDVVGQDQVIQKLKKKLRDTQAKYNQALQKLTDTEQTLMRVLNTRTYQPDYTHPLIVPATDSGDLPTVIPILLWSDWHVGEYVNPDTVNQANFFDPNVARQRALTLFKNTLTAIRMLQRSYTVDTLVIWLGGDFITGYIHEELLESNTMSPIQESIFAMELIQEGIKHLLDNTNISKLYVPCNFGNHGRLTEKTRVSTAHVNNLEWLMYNILSDRYRDNPRVTFLVCDGHILYLNVWDKVLRFTHGDAVSSSGGVTGLTRSVSHWIQKQDNFIKADMTFFGHFHNTLFGKNFTTNNCLIGATPYSIRLGFAVEPAEQAMVVLEQGGSFNLRLGIATQ